MRNHPPAPWHVVWPPIRIEELLRDRESAANCYTSSYPPRSLIQKNRVFLDSKMERSLTTMKFLMTLERDEDGVWIADCPSIPGCVSQGETRQDALDNIREAIAACLEVRADLGMPLTLETQQVEVAKGTLRSLIRSSGLTAEEFSALAGK